MLRELHISNLAVIEDARIEFREGLHCFTGQTGAGKSLVLGALELLLGLRSGAEMLRDGSTDGRVSGVFELSDPQLARHIAALADIEVEEGQLLITRKLFATGRTSFSINGSPATASMARAIGELLVDVHGQHDHQYLLKPANQLDMLDRFADAEPLRDQFAALHGELAGLRQRRAQLEASQSLRSQQLELYEFQAEEIDKVAPCHGEYEEIAARHKLLSNLRRVQQDSAAAYSAMYESEGSVLERLTAVVGVLRQLSELDEELAPVAESVKAAAAQVQDAAFDLSRYLNRVDLDPAELSEVTDRLNALNRLIHKYGHGGGLDAVIRFREEIDAQMKTLRAETADFQEIDERIEPLRARLAEVGEALTARRRAAADRIKPLIERELAELGMGHAKFDVAFGAAAGEDSSPTGLDSIEMLVQANPGQSPRPLRKVASGGELSRIMLAIKSILADADRISVLVFDEIDANIGGRIASTIGTKLRLLAARHQVLCITHLPQIAAYADQHVKITKAVAAGQTRVHIDSLETREARVAELAEMLTGKQQSPTTLRQAGELLDAATTAGSGARPPRRSRLRLTA